MLLFLLTSSGQNVLRLRSGVVTGPTHSKPEESSNNTDMYIKRVNGWRHLTQLINHLISVSPLWLNKEM